MRTHPVRKTRIRSRPANFDTILAAAVLHLLDDDAEWQAVFEAFHRSLRPGGGLRIADLVAHDEPAIQFLMWARYGDYLVEQRGDAYRDKVSADNVACAQENWAFRAVHWRTRDYLALGLAVKQTFTCQVDMAVAFRATLGNRIVRQASSVDEC